MSCFPFFMEVGGRNCLVVGGGTVALRKAEALLPFGVRVTAVAPRFCLGMLELAGVRRIARGFLPEDLEGMAFAIGATDDDAVNAEIARLCGERGIPVNIVDDREKCSFFFPALVKRGEVVAGISTGGNSPLAARYVREWVEEALPPRIGEAVTLLGGVRGRARREIADAGEREAALRRLLALALERDVAAEELERILKGGGGDGRLP